MMMDIFRQQRSIAGLVGSGQLTELDSDEDSDYEPETEVDEDEDEA